MTMWLLKSQILKRLSNQVLARMWRNWSAYMLLVWLYEETTIVQKVLVVFKETKHITTLWPRNYDYGYSSMGHENILQLETILMILTLDPK